MTAPFFFAKEVESLFEASCFRYYDSLLLLVFPSIMWKQEKEMCFME